MLVIRLTRKGKKNQPFFNIVVIDKRRAARGGRAVDIVGYVDPLTKRKSLKKEQILHWISKGAQPSPTIHNLLVQEKIIEGTKINLSKKKKGAENAAPAAPAPTQTPTPALAAEEPKEEKPAAEPAAEKPAEPEAPAADQPV